MSTDPFAHDDAAYVLGALAPAERRAFEEHLAECAACTRAVRDLAGLPGLLSQVGESAFTEPEDLPVPDTLLLQLLRRVRRQRRRIRLLAVAGTAAAVVLAAVLLGVLLVGGSGPTRPPAQAMTPVDQHWLSATVSLQQVAWGTRVHLTCTYEEDGDDYDQPVPSYALMVHTRDGDTQQVATWRAVPGRTTDLDAATDASPDQITGVDVVRTGTGRRVLTLG